MEAQINTVRQKHCEVNSSGHMIGPFSLQRDHQFRIGYKGRWQWSKMNDEGKPALKKVGEKGDQRGGGEGVSQKCGVTRSAGELGRVLTK